MGLDCGSEGGMLCLLDVSASKVSLIIVCFISAFLCIEFFFILFLNSGEISIEESRVLLFFFLIKDV